MKFLHSVILFTKFVEYVTASNLERTNLHDAIDKEGDYETYKRLCGSNKSLQLAGISYVTGTKSSRSIIGFIRKTEPIKSYTLTALYNGGSMTTIKAVLKQIVFSQDDLIVAASNSQLMCSPEKYVDLLKRIEAKEAQTSVVVKGIEGLFDKENTDCILPLLAAMEGEAFRNEDLIEIAVQKTFREGVLYCSEVGTKDCYNHPAITAEVYASGLIESGRCGVDSPVFEWLLEHADEDDLAEVVVRRGYPKLGTHFRVAIEEAMSKASPGGTRTSAVVSKAQVVKETLYKTIQVSTLQSNERIYEILSEYLAEE